MTHLSLMITEWAKTMQVLSNMLVQHVYNLDPEAFPLDKPTEKTRRIKGRKPKTAAETESSVVRSVSEDPSRALKSKAPTSPMSDICQETEQMSIHMEGQPPRMRRAVSETDTAPPSDEYNCANQETQRSR
jgi:hypothetical protein